MGKSTMKFRRWLLLMFLIVDLVICITSYCIALLKTNFKSKNKLNLAVCSVVLLALFGCSTQPDWLVRKRNYGQGEVITSRQVTDYDFNWRLSGSPYAMPVQVFTVSDEVWVQWPPDLPQPKFKAYRHSHNAASRENQPQQITLVTENSKKARKLQVESAEFKPLTFYHKPPYFIIKKGNWQRLVFNLYGQEAYADFNGGFLN